jgi:hypothetical protein
MDVAPIRRLQRRLLAMPVKNGGLALEQTIAGCRGRIPADYYRKQPVVRGRREVGLKLGLGRFLAPVGNFEPLPLHETGVSRKGPDESYEQPRRFLGRKYETIDEHRDERGRKLRVPIIQGFQRFIVALAGAYPKLNIEEGRYSRLVEQVQIFRPPRAEDPGPSHKSHN